MKRLLALTVLSLGLAACGVDTTGLTPTSSRNPAGNPNAAVTVTEFADIQCPACRSAHLMLEKPLLEKYGQQIRFDFKHFPLQTIHQYALELAQASECAADQGKFWEFIDVAYQNQLELERLAHSAPATWAGGLGIDMDVFNRCLESRIKKDLVLADYDEGIKAGVQGTPTFFVNGQKTDATMEALSAAIDAGLQNGANRF
jgi:protein-disulfide isomerase